MNLEESVEIIKSTHKAKSFILEYFNHKINSYTSEIDIKKEIYNTILNHHDYNNLKDIWFPLPTDREISYYLRNSKIKTIVES